MDKEENRKGRKRWRERKERNQERKEEVLKVSIKRNKLRNNKKVASAKKKIRKGWKLPS